MPAARPALLHRLQTERSVLTSRREDSSSVREEGSR